MDAGKKSTKAIAVIVAVIVALVLIPVMGIGFFSVAASLQTEREEYCILRYNDEYGHEVERTWGIGVDEHGNEYEFSTTTVTFGLALDDYSDAIPISGQSVWEERLDTD